MARVVDFLNQGWVGVIVGVVLSLVLYVRAKRAPRLSYSLESIQVIRLADEPDISQNVSVMYRGSPVPKLTAVTVTLWNSGTATLEGAALVARDLLRVSGGDASEVLEASIELDEKPACGAGIEVSRDRSALHLHFDFLDPGDGYMVRLLHTGTPQSTAVAGVLKGVPLVDESKSLRKVDRIFRSLPYKLCAFLAFFASMSMFIDWYRGESYPALAAWLGITPGDDRGARLALLLFASGAFVASLVVDTVGDFKAHRVPFKFRRRFRRASGRIGGTSSVKAEGVALRKRDEQ